MHQPLDAIEYLARSEHRVEVLDAIRSKPRTRAEIRSLADASRVTVGRIIADLEERGWIVRIGQRYEVTPRGEFIAAEFTRLIRNLESFESLPPVFEWIPGDQPTFDLWCLADATVVSADESDLIAPIRRALNLIARSEDLRIIANSASREFAEATRAAVEKGQTHTLIVPPKTVDAMRGDPDLHAATREMLESGRATLLQYDGDDDLPVVQIGDGTVALCSGDHQTMVETDDESVYEWAESYFASLCADTIPVSLEAFADETTVVEGEA